MRLLQFQGTANPSHSAPRPTWVQFPVRIVQALAEQVGFE